MARGNFEGDYRKMPDVRTRRTDPDLRDAEPEECDLSDDEAMDRAWGPADLTEQEALEMLADMAQECGDG
jgi:hypothetical protein